MARQSAVPCSSIHGSLFINPPHFQFLRFLGGSSICCSVLVNPRFPLHQSSALPISAVPRWLVNLRLRAGQSTIPPSSFDIFQGMVCSRAKSLRGTTWQIFQPPGKGIRAAAMTIGRTFCLLVAGLCMAAIGYAASYWYPLPQPGTQPADVATPAPVENPTRIEAMGRIEPVSGTLTVAAIPGEEIVQLSAHVGQTVKKDVVLAVLGSQKLRSEERILAEQQLEKAQRQFEAEQGAGETATRRGADRAGTGCRSGKGNTDRGVDPRGRRASGISRRATRETRAAQAGSSDPGRDCRGGARTAAIAHQTNPSGHGPESRQAGSGP